VINRRLYKIATRTVTYLSAAEKRRDMFVDLAIGLGIPILQMAMGASLPGRFLSSVLMALQSSSLRDIALTSSRKLDAIQTSSIHLLHWS
jgi:hypothetical protein